MLPATRRATTLALLAGLVVVVALVLIARDRGDRDGNQPLSAPNDTSQLIKIVIEGRGNVVEDRDLIERLSGTQSIDDDQVGAAFCVNGLDWSQDYTLGTEIAISTDPALVRAAELYDQAIGRGDLDAAALAVRVEQAFWQHDDIDGVRDWADFIPDDGERASVLGYIEERQQPPSHEALERFVVYAVQDLATQRNVFYLDTFRVRPALLQEPASNPLPGEALVAGEDETRNVDLGDCDELADDWDRFDSSLPALPPLEDRWQLELDESV